ncbi:MAG: 16S rRNA (uracil(1498)-N(3))-methyltransferase [Chloroflexi bacterium]|nr:16S rRNA (uracil(1498)-N(3))-methyltransferase [Chloroflexota bacterium]
MHRFFVPPEWLAGRNVGDEVHLAGPVARQLARVLRARPGEHIALLDDTGWAVEAVLQALAPGAATARIVSRTIPPTEPRLELTLYQALPKHRKFDWILQKGTELGVSTFVPLITRHSDVRRGERSPDHKVERWQRILGEAAEQSGRTRRPRVLGVQAFEEACEAPPEGVLALMPYEGEQEQSLAAVLQRHAAAPPRGVRLYIGPEGGYDPQEVAWARDRGVERVSLGPRILRAETAALAAVAIVLYALGDAAS